MPFVKGIFGDCIECLVIELKIEIDPISVLFFNEFDFPRPVPFLDLVFTRFSSIACVMKLKPDETIHIIATGERCAPFFLVSMNARGNIVSVTTIECTVFLTREQVDVECHSEIEGQNHHFWKGIIETPQVPVKTGTHA